MKISSLLIKFFSLVLALSTGFSTLTLADPPKQRLKLKFVGVDLNLNSTRNQSNDSKLADSKLANYLTENALVKISEEEAQTYERMVRKLVDWKTADGPYLARVTPYVFVAASMLGADFEILATYKNPSGKAIYHSYIVINRKLIPSSPNAQSSTPTLEQIVGRLRETQARFIYHDKFSTSSYFLPTLFFRNNDIYSMPDAAGANLKAIETEDINKDKAEGQVKLGSSELIKRVALNENEVAAVWDVTMNKASDEDKGKVYFVPLPNEIPNDLLVCSANLQANAKEELRQAIRQMSPNQIDLGDFKTWVDIETAGDATQAREALSQLRHLADQHTTPVTIKVENSSTSPIAEPLLETIKYAIRLSNTEFVPHDEDYHRKEDVKWDVETMHSGAIRLVSKINYTDLNPQEFELSFTDPEDLSKRIGAIIHSRMHRIRYIWPYEDRFPTVIRDVDFPVTAQSVFKVIKITWNDPKRNDFGEWDQFNATVSKVDRFGFQLEAGEFPKKFDPMSNTSYRVVLVRDTKEGRIFTVLTYVFVGLLLLAGVGAVFDMRRRVKKLRDVPIVNMEDFKRKCHELAEKYRCVWRKHKLTDADVVWCDRKRLDALIADLKANGNGNVEFDSVKTRTRSVAAHIPILNKYLGLSVGAGVNVINTTDPSKFSDTQRLGDTIAYLMNQNAFSSFVGEKMQWDALNQLASDVFEPFTLETSQAGNNGCGDLIRSEHPMLLSLIGKHFYEVVQESKEKVCFFGRKWTVVQKEKETILVCTADLLAPIKFNGGSSLVQKVTLQAQISRDVDLSDLIQDNQMSAWLFGKIHRVDTPRNGDGVLFLNFKPAALVKTDD